MSELYQRFVAITTQYAKSRASGSSRTQILARFLTELQNEQKRFDSLYPSTEAFRFLRRRVAVYTSELILFCTAKREYELLHRMIEQGYAEAQEVMYVWCTSGVEDIPEQIQMVPLLQQDLQAHLQDYIDMATRNQFTSLLAYVEHVQQDKQKHIQELQHLRQHLSSMNLYNRDLLRDLVNEMED